VVTGDVIRVTAQFVFQPLTPLASSVMTGGRLTLSATAQRVFE
jgi:hypothetical protein